MPTLVIKSLRFQCLKDILPTNTYLLDMLLNYTCVFSHIHLAGKHLADRHLVEPKFCSK
jgi:hypothetical protein